MLTLERKTSPSSTRAKLSRRFTRPSRIAFTSVPSRTSPASNVSRRWKSWNAFRFSAMFSFASSRSDLPAMRRSCPPSGGPRQPRGQQHRGDHAFGVRNPFAGDVERRAVGDRRPDDRKPERDGDCAPECGQLHRNEPLIVRAGDDDGEFALAGAYEQRVGGKWSRDVDAFGATALYRRNDRRRLFASKQAMLAGVRIQARDGDARLHFVEFRKLTRRQRDRLLEHTIALTARELPKFDKVQPRIAVAGLNPHAGEHGLFGGEEATAIVPAIERKSVV